MDHIGNTSPSSSSFVVSCSYHTDRVKNVTSQLLHCCMLHICCLATAVSCGFTVLALSKYATIIFVHDGRFGQLYESHWKKYMFHCCARDVLAYGRLHHVTALWVYQSVSRKLSELAACLLLAWFALWSLRWRQCVSPNYLWISNLLHGITSQKIVPFMITTIRTSNTSGKILILEFSSFSLNCNSDDLWLLQEYAFMHLKMNISWNQL
jgi:hypothetical protein